MASYSPALLLIGGWLAAGPAIASDAALAVEFNAGFLRGFQSQQSTDLSRFAHGNPVEPGQRRLKIKVNGQEAGESPVTFAAGDDGVVVPCIAHAQLEAYGADPRYRQQGVALDQCIGWHNNPWQARWHYDALQQQLLISVPQKYLSGRPRDWIDPASWQQGINAAYINYNYDMAELEYQGGGLDGRRQFLGLDVGVNLGPWRLRNRSSYNDPIIGKAEFQSQQTYLQRDITALRGQLSLGDITVADDFFQPFSLRGVQLESDGQMLPLSYQAYAPIIRGVANSDAVVEIYQNGYLVDSRQVAPGPFEFRDVHASGVGADLEVLVREADGSERRFRQPYASVPKLLREDVWRYRFSAGAFREHSGDLDPLLVQGLLGRGLEHGLSSYAGLTATSFYHSYLLGLAQDMGGWGALSVDAQHAVTDSQGVPGGSRQTLRGESYRLLYAKRFVPTRTDLRMIGYRYSSKHYRSLSEAVYLDAGRPIGASEKDRWELSLAQNLGAMSLSLSMARQSYWDAAEQENVYQAGVNGYWRSLSWALDYTLTENSQRFSQASGGRDESVSLALSVPLTRQQQHYSYLGSGYRHHSQGADAIYATVSGAAFEERRLSYSAQVSREVSAETDAGSSSQFLSVGYRSRAALLRASRSQTPNYRQRGLGVRGSALWHGDGVTLGQPINGSVALVQVPGVERARVSQQSGVSTDRHGYALVSSVSPYRNNRISLDAHSLPEQALVEQGYLEVVPRRDAIVLASFRARQGRNAVFTLTLPGGDFVPFGASVLDQDNREVGLVGDNGRGYLSAIAEQGRFTVRWGAGQGGECRFDYVLADQPGLAQLARPCVFNPEQSQLAER